MKLIVLGSGTCVPSLKRNSPGYLIEVQGRQILVDCGSGVPLQLEKAGRSYKAIDAVFLTHFHPDHTAGIIPLIHALIATPLFQRNKELSLIGPPGLIKFYGTCIAPVIASPGRFSVVLIEVRDTFDYPPLRVFTAVTVHSEPSIAYRFEHGETSLVFTGDAEYEPRIIELSRDADLLVADCSFPESMKRRGHMTSRDCGLLAQKAGVKNLLLSHLYPLPVADDQRLDECREVFHGPVSIAEDLAEFNL